MQKNSVFQAASFGDLLLNEKQKKPFVSLNNEVTEALPVCLKTLMMTMFPHARRRYQGNIKLSDYNILVSLQ